MTIEEKRRYPRLVLKIDEGYFGNFKLADGNTIVAPIVNISAGGLNMIAPESAKESIQEGDQLLLAKIAGGASITFIHDVKSEVRWIKPLDTSGSLSVGCQLKELPDELRAQLDRFVDTERMTRGQYD